MIATREPTDEEIQAEFKLLMPELSSRLRTRFFENGPYREDELTAEAVAICWDTYRSARRRGRTPTASNLSWYAIGTVLAGRRLTGSTSLDALSSTKLARSRIGEHVSLCESSALPECVLYTTFSDRRWRWPIIDVVGPQLDWDQFVAGCDERDQRIVEMKIAGFQQTEIAEELGISPPAVCQRLSAMRRRWDAQAVA